MAPKDGAVEDVGAIREQLGHILSSPEFHVPDRGRRFLQYVVDEALEGRSEGLDAYAIAMAVFGRGAGFDAQSDPVVRIEAGRVRRALERYYLVSGSNDPVIITIPKGRYAPSFEQRGQGAEVSAFSTAADGMPRTRQESGRFAYRDLLVPLGVPAVFAGLAMLALIRPLEHYLSPSPVQPVASKRQQTKIVVEPLFVLGGMPDGADIGRRLRDQLISQLIKLDGVVILDPGFSASRPAAASMFALQGNIMHDEDILHVQVRLIAANDGRVVWANRFDFEPAGRDTLDLQAQICARIVNGISGVEEIQGDNHTH